MDREMMKNILHDLVSGDSTTIDGDTLGMLFPPGEAAGVIDKRTPIKATAFAREHGCRFLFDGPSRNFTFLKLPGRWYELIDTVNWLLWDLLQCGKRLPSTGACLASLSESQMQTENGRRNHL